MAKKKKIITDKNIVTKEMVITKLKDIFSDHVGKTNPISSESLFIQITGINPEILDFYEKAYRWNAIKRTLASLRHSGELFVIMGVYHHYVLNNTAELETYEYKVDATIRGLKEMKKKAKKWIGSKTLKQMKKKKIAITQ